MIIKISGNPEVIKEFFKAVTRGAKATGLNPILVAQIMSEAMDNDLTMDMTSKEVNKLAQEVEKRVAKAAGRKTWEPEEMK